MAKKIHFKDNLFYLARRLDGLSDGLFLDLDTEFFLDKIIDDILFYNSAISRTYDLLRENSSISEYCEQMRNLYSVQKKYISILERILDGQTCFTAEFQPFFQKFREINKIQTTNSKNIYTFLTSDILPPDIYDAVSQDEMNALFHF